MTSPFFRSLIDTAQEHQTYFLDEYDCDFSVKNKNIALYADNNSINMKFPFLRGRYNCIDDDYDYIIVGGGLFGCMFAAVLKKFFPQRSFIIIDPHIFLCESFFSIARNIHMRYMRSGHHAHIAPDTCLSLIDFSMIFYDQLSEFDRKQLEMARSGERSIVPVDIFKAHTAFLLNSLRLNENHIIGSLKNISFSDELAILEISNMKSLRAKNVIFATGLRANLPVGLPNMKYHGFYRIVEDLKGPRICVVGGGQTAANWVSLLIKKNFSVIWCIKGEEIIVKCFDFPSKYRREDQIVDFSRKSYLERKRILDELSAPSVMPEVALDLSYNKIDIKYGFTMTSIETVDGECHILSDSGDKIIADDIIVCTGACASTFPVCEGGAAKSKCYYIGAASKNQYGPSAGNIIGAQVVSDNIIKFTEDYGPHSKKRSYFSGNREIS